MSEPEAIRLRTDYDPDGPIRVSLDQETWPHAMRIADALIMSGSPYLITSSPGLVSRAGDRLTITLENARAVYRLERYRDLYEEWDAVFIEGEVLREEIIRFYAATGATWPMPEEVAGEQM